MVFYYSARKKSRGGLRKELVYMIFKKIHEKFIESVNRDLAKEKDKLFWIFDTSENESEGAFYDRFLQI